MTRCLLNLLTAMSLLLAVVCLIDASTNNVFRSSWDR